MILQNKSLSGKPPSKEAQYYIDWALETHKKNISTIDGFLSQIIALDLGLIAIYFSFSKIIYLSDFTKIYFIPSMVAISLVFAIYGIFPRITNLDIRRPFQIKIYKENTLKRKYHHLFFSFIALLIAVIGGLVNFIIQNYN